MGRIKDNARQRQAAELRDTGLSFTEIGEVMGVTKQRAEQLVKDRPRPPAKKPAVCSKCGQAEPGPANPWKEARHAKLWSTRQAAKEAGVSASLVSRVENGREIELSAGVALARAYGVPVESLVPAP